MVKSMGIESKSCDGYDADKTYSILNNSIKKIKKNYKPIFLEFSTCRWLEHCGPNDDTPLNYRSKSELKNWKEKDPLSKLLKSILRNKKNIKTLNKIDKLNKDKIKRAFNFAKKSKFPSLADAFKDLYA